MTEMQPSPSLILKRSVMSPLLKEILEENDLHIAEISSDRNYWFIRTQGGSYFDEFFFGGFVAIGWDDIPCIPESERTEAILQQVQDKGYGIPNRVMNQVYRFCTAVNPGDVVIIPSESSLAFAFGYIESDVYEVKPTQDDIEAGKCQYTRRRKVKWVFDTPKGRIDPKLYAFFRNQQALSSANDCAEFIDRALSPFYIKDGKAHLTLGIEIEKSPRADDIPAYMHGILTRTYDIAEELKLLPSSSKENNPLEASELSATAEGIESVPEVEESNNEIEETEEDDLIRSRINVQSAGIIELLGDPTFVFLVAIVVIALLGGKVRFKKDEKSTSGEISTGGLPDLIKTISKVLLDHKDNKHIGDAKIKKIQTRLKIDDPRKK